MELLRGTDLISFVMVLVLCCAVVIFQLVEASGQRC